MRRDGKEYDLISLIDRARKAPPGSPIRKIAEDLAAAGELTLAERKALVARAIGSTGGAPKGPRATTRRGAVAVVTGVAYWHRLIQAYDRDPAVRKHFDSKVPNVARLLKRLPRVTPKDKARQLVANGRECSIGEVKRIERIVRDDADLARQATRIIEGMKLLLAESWG